MSFDVFSSKFAQDIFLQKYSLNGQESWSDTARRVVSSVCGQLISKEEQEEIYKIIAERKFIPGGRYLYASGRPLHQVNNCFSGSTRFLTDQGVFSLKEKNNNSVRVRNWKGEWESAEVRSFGQQELHKMTLSNGDSFLTTANHLWIQPDGSRVDTLRAKRVMLSEGDSSIMMDPEGIRHGIIYGDGHIHTKGNYSEIVLVSDKKYELINFFENQEKEIIVGFGAKRTYSTIRKTKAGIKIALQPVHYKQLPKQYTPEYARGFIAGLIATDGHVSKQGSILISCEGLDKANEIRDIVIAAGCVVSSVRVNSKKSPFDNSNRQLCNIYIKPFSAPVILECHKANIKGRKFYKRELFLDVVDVSATGLTEEVYCVVAPKTNTFTLHNGVLTSNCFLFRATDSREGWAEVMNSATSALMTGGGIGVDYSALREEGAAIKGSGGKSTGPIALMNMVNESGRYIMQGGQRRSAIWAGLNWQHKDIQKFMSLKNWPEDIRRIKETDFNFPVPMELTNISVIYDTEFFIAVEDVNHPKHAEALNVWLQNCKQAFSTAEPGMSMNFRKDNESLRNACVTGDTEILTKQGYQQIETLVNQEVEVWNGFEWSKVTPKITGRDQEMLTITFSNGASLTCTKYHKFHVATDYNNGFKIVEAKDLVEGMKLIKHKFPVIEGSKNLEAAYLQGFHSAEGMDGYKFIYVYEPKYLCLEGRLGKFGKHVGKSDNYGRVRFVHGKDLLPKSFVPIDYNIKSKIDWLSGVLDGDGTELKEGGVQLGSVDREFLLNIQKLLSTLGISSKVTLAKTSGFKVLPDGRGGHSDFYCKDFYRLLIGAVQMQELKALGLACDRLKFNKTPQRDASQFVKISSIDEADKAEVVYCFNEPKNHTGIFNGVLTGQCTEVVSEDDSDKCNLGTVWINRIKNKKELAHVVKLATKFLLCGGIYSDVPNNKIDQIGKKNNRIGLGLGGMHEWLMVRGEDYEVTSELHKWLSIYEQESDSAAFIGAKQLGVSVPKGVRAIAPTGTIGIIAETTTGIEPLFCKAYKRRYLKNHTWVYQYVVDGAVKRLQAQGVKIDQIKDAYDINFKQRVKFQADVQNYVDMAISSTCNLQSWGSEENNEGNLREKADLLLKYAKRLRGFTCYPDGARGGQPLTRVDLQEALANEGTVFEETENSCVNGVCGI